VVVDPPPPFVVELVVDAPPPPPLDDVVVDVGPPVVPLLESSPQDAMPARIKPVSVAPFSERLTMELNIFTSRKGWVIVILPDPGM
jgi:hypothetical protein